MAKTHRPLNNMQTDILLSLYKFRFATRDLLVRYQGLNSPTYTHYRLRNLLEQKYIGRHFDSSYRLHNKPAIYYLLPDGIRFLKQHAELGLNLKALNLLYKDHGAGEEFIYRCLRIFRLFLQLEELYADKLAFYTATEITEYGYFPKQLPHAFMALDHNGDTAEFMLELFDSSTAPFVVRQRLSRYCKHFKLGTWDKAGTVYPVLLFVCETPTLERRISKTMLKLIYDGDLTSDIRVYITSTAKVEAMTKENTDIWHLIDEPEANQSLEDIS